MAASLVAIVHARALALADDFPGFHFDSLEGELARLRLKRALRRAAPGMTAEHYEAAVRRAESFASASKRAGRRHEP